MVVQYVTSPFTCKPQESLPAVWGILMFMWQRRTWLARSSHPVWSESCYTVCTVLKSGSGKGKEENEKLEGVENKGRAWEHREKTHFYKS